MVQALRLIPTLLDKSMAKRVDKGSFHSFVVFACRRIGSYVGLIPRGWNCGEYQFRRREKSDARGKICIEDDVNARAQYSRSHRIVLSTE